MKDLGIKLLTGAITGVAWAIVMVLLGLIARGCWIFLSFGWNLI